MVTLAWPKELLDKEVRGVRGAPEGMRGRNASGSMGEVDRHDVEAWRAGSSKRSMRFPGAAVHVGGKGERGILLSHVVRCSQRILSR